MKILFYEPFAGISGDMNLGAMIDLGVEENYLIGELKKLGLENEYNISVSKSSKMGIGGTKVDVRLKDYQPLDPSNLMMIPGKGHHHHHRNLPAIEKIIDDSGLNEEVKSLSKKIFMHVAKAESKVHGLPLNEVHFHEVGATDSIVDIIGAAICFHNLKIGKVISTPIELGGGFVTAAHGKMPVPAPATAEIVKNIPVKYGGVDHEATTPTGAAILAELVDEFVTAADLKIQKTAYGIGHRDVSIPNILRVNLAEEVRKPYEMENAVLLECNIDDMSNEVIGNLMERILEAGADDVSFQNIQMKKNRPAIILSVLCIKEKEEFFKELLFKETSTFGIKTFRIEKSMLKREVEEVETSLGLVQVKRGFYNNEVLKSKVEFEDVLRISKETGIPLMEVYKKIEKEI